MLYGARRTRAVSTAAAATATRTQPRRSPRTQPRAGCTDTSVGSGICGASGTTKFVWASSPAAYGTENATSGTMNSATGTCALSGAAGSGGTTGKFGSGTPVSPFPYLSVSTVGGLYASAVDGSSYMPLLGPTTCPAKQPSPPPPAAPGTAFAGLVLSGAYNGSTWTFNLDSGAAVQARGGPAAGRAHPCGRSCRR